MLSKCIHSHWSRCIVISDSDFSLSGPWPSVVCIVMWSCPTFRISSCTCVRKQTSERSRSFTGVVHHGSRIRISRHVWETAVAASYQYSIDRWMVPAAPWMAIHIYSVLFTVTGWSTLVWTLVRKIDTSSLSRRIWLAEALPSSSSGEWCLKAQQTFLLWNVQAVDSAQRTMQFVNPVWILHFTYLPTTREIEHALVFWRGRGIQAS